VTAHGSGRPDGGLYELLGLAPGAPEEAIRGAVTEQRRTWRRRTASADITVRQQAELRMQQLDEAERTLLDPALRRTYDLAAQPHTTYPPQAPPTPPTPPDPANPHAPASPLASRNPQAPAIPPTSPTSQASSAPESPAEPARTDGRQWLVRAVEQLDRDQFEVATFTARRAVDADPGNFYAWSVLAEAAARAGEHDTARDAIEYALTLRPEDPKLHAMRGWILARAGDLGRSVSAYRTAAKLEPTQPDHRVRAVRALIDQGRFDEAIDEAQLAYQVSPDDADTRTALARALFDRAIAAQHELPDGRLLIASLVQASQVESLCNRGLSVQSPEERVNADLRSQRDYARKARRRAFSPHAFRQNYRWPIGLGLLAVAVVCCAPNFVTGAGQDPGSVGARAAYGGVVLLMLAALVTAVIVTCTEPVYKRNAEVIEHTVPRRLGRGPGEPDPPR
jgi:Flp pilus assembly protein TadD